MWRMNWGKMILAAAFFVPVLVLVAKRSADAAEPPPPPSLSLPGCTDTCGNLKSIPYPFGIGPGCSLSPLYEIDCQQTRGIHTPVLKNLSVVVLDIQLPRSSHSPGLISVSQPISYSHVYCPNNRQNNTPVDLRGTNKIFRYSQRKNYFVAGGCDIQAMMVINHTPGRFVGCTSLCGGNRTLGFYRCLSSTGCCQTSIINNIRQYSVEFKTLRGERVMSTDVECEYAFLVKAAWWFQADLDSLPPDVPVVLEWAITPQAEGQLRNQSNKRHNNNSGSCRRLGHSFRKCKQSNGHSSCQRRWSYNRVSCACNQGYKGNYFLPQGCQDVNECKEVPDINCRGKCVNRPGTYHCIDNKIITIASVSAGAGAIVLLLLSWWVYKFIKRRRAAKLQQKFFQHNGGLVLLKRLSSIDDNHTAKGKLFASTELDKATNHFNNNRILGQGGQGTVYKGMLMDGTIIAVKKSKVVDAGQVERFINEVVILSEINHRNVVKLLGFCLESEVPLLIYEFIPNGTLYQYLHDPREGFSVSWETRLRIANEVAGALLYLHFAAAIPIYHRDIKSSNILLDEKYRAKVADFGASRSITIDQTHLTTKVQGTIGYLDPEYYQTSQFTDKSDVFSFGVVLVELLTGEKPISELRAEEGRSLAVYFVDSMEENRLFDILDKEVLHNGEKEEIIAVSILAKRCLNFKGRYRPTMKEVAMELERVRSLQNPAQNDEETDRIRTGSICPSGSGTVSPSTPSEADVELTLLEEDKSLVDDLPR